MADCPMLSGCPFSRSNEEHAGYFRDLQENYCRGDNTNCTFYGPADVRPRTCPRGSFPISRKGLKP